MSPAVVSTASPSPIGAFSVDSRCTSGPPARAIAAATPPPCRNWVLAALAIASTSSLVTSACTTSNSVIGTLSRRTGARSDRRQALGRRCRDRRTWRSESCESGAPAPRAQAKTMRRLIPVSARAGIVVTGTEVLTGRVQDRNGPWIADRLLELGVELAHITICGDRPADIEAQLRFMADQGVDLIVTSGGLGPTADDMTVEVVARFCERELLLDAEVEEKIANILKKLMARNPAFQSALDPGTFESLRAANRKQAMVPAGAQVLDPVGTAPGVVVPGRPTVIVLPGPPRELQPMWHTAIQTP